MLSRASPATAGYGCAARCRGSRTRHRALLHRPGRPRGRRERQAPVLSVKCWRNTWGPLRTLLREGIELAPGMVVVLGGASTSTAPGRRSTSSWPSWTSPPSWAGWPPSGPSCCGPWPPRASGAQPRPALPAVPLRVGLVASPGTEGYRDFLGQLTGSGFAFEVTAVPATVQGAEAPGRHRRRPCALRPRARGARPGGAGARRGVTGRPGAFDAEPVARAIAASPCRCGPASATPATSRWPTWWPTVPASPRPSAAGSWPWGRPVVGGLGGRPGRAGVPPGHRGGGGRR